MESIKSSFSQLPVWVMGYRGFIIEILTRHFITIKALLLTLSDHLIDLRLDNINTYPCVWTVGFGGEVRRGLHGSLLRGVEGNERIRNIMKKRGIKC